MDNSIKLLSSDGAKTLETAFGHCAPVTCLALSPDSNYLVTGSRDTTVILWKINRGSASRSSNLSEPSTGSGTPTVSTSTPANILTDKTRRRRIEGPMHVLRGHRGEILCCCVNSDLGIVVSCSYSSDVLIHSIRRGRLIRRLVGVKAHTVCLSSQGVVITWDKTQHTLNTFSLNGIPIAKAQLPFTGTVSCIDISVDGRSVLLGMNLPVGDDGMYNMNNNLSLKKSETEYFDLERAVTEEKNKLDVPSPSVCFLDLHTLKV